MATLHALLEQVIYKTCQHLPGCNTADLRATMIADMHDAIPASARLAPESPFQVLVRLGHNLDVDHPLVDRETTELGYHMARILQTTTTRFKSLASSSVESIVSRAEAMMALDVDQPSITPVRVCTWGGLTDATAHNAALEVLTSLNIPLEQLRDRHLTFMSLHVKSPTARWVTTAADQLHIESTLKAIDVDVARTCADLKSNVTATNVITSLKRAIAEPNGADRQTLMPTVDRIEAMHLAVNALASSTELSTDFHTGLEALRTSLTQAHALLALAREMIFRTALVLPGSSTDLAYVNCDLVERAPEQITNTDIGLVVQYAARTGIGIPVRGMPQATVLSLLPRAQAIQTALESDRETATAVAAKRRVVDRVSTLVDQFHTAYIATLPAVEAAAVTRRMEQTIGTLRVQLGRYEVAPIDQTLAAYLCRTYGSPALSDVYAEYTRRVSVATESMADGTPHVSKDHAHHSLMAAASACMWRRMTARHVYQHREYSNLVA